MNMSPAEEAAYERQQERMFGSTDHVKDSVKTIEEALEKLGHVDLGELALALNDVSRVDQPVVIGNLRIEKV